MIGCNRRGGESSVVIGGVIVLKLKKINLCSGFCSIFKLGSRWWNFLNLLYFGMLLVVILIMLFFYYFGIVVCVLFYL